MDRTQPCGGLDRPAQSFVQLKTNEWVSLANPAMCITTRGGAGLQASECARLIGDANTVPNNPTQQWTTTNLSQFKRGDRRNLRPGQRQLPVRHPGWVCH
jgi:hypothetical protein